MINLLPPEIKKSYSFAQRNVILRHWLVAFVFAFIGLGVIATFGLLTIKQSTQTYSKDIKVSEAYFKEMRFSDTQSQVQDISSSIKLVTKVLSQEVLFSLLLKQIAAAIPANANLTGLNINQTQGGLDITAVAKNYDAATQVQVNLADPANKIFSKADIVGITCSTANATNGDYPCTVTIRALFSTKNPFLFINSAQVSQ